MRIAEDSDLCCGCMACEQVCPCKAISESENENGFLIPFVNNDKCIQCGACQKVCPVNDASIVPKLSDQRIYGGWLKSDHARGESQSGGAFTAFAQTILRRGGIVYGAGLDSDDGIVKYTRVDCENELCQIKGSKYVQAYTGSIFSRVKKDLWEGKTVLFSGTSCHIDGLLHFIPRNEQENLITCDLVCHGVPSPMIFKDYISYLKMLHKEEIEQFRFRDKEKGWHSHCESYYVKKVVEKEYSTVYADIFYSHLIFRESCYNCKYASYERLSDLTVGDFWGIEKTHPECSDEKGYSLILVNSAKGVAIFEEAKQYLNWLESNRESCVQHNLLYPSEKNKKTKKFWEQYHKKGFLYVAKKYTSLNKNKLIWRKLRRLVKFIKF